MKGGRDVLRCFALALARLPCRRFACLVLFALVLVAAVSGPFVGLSVGDYSGSFLVSADASEGSTGDIVGPGFEPSSGEWQPLRRSLWDRVYGWVTGLFEDDEEDPGTDEFSQYYESGRGDIRQMLGLSPLQVVAQPPSSFIRFDSVLFNTQIFDTVYSSDSQANYLPYTSADVSLILGQAGFSNSTLTNQNVSSRLGPMSLYYYKFDISQPIEAAIATLYRLEYDSNGRNSPDVDKIEVFLVKDPDFSYSVSSDYPDLMRDHYAYFIHDRNRVYQNDLYKHNYIDEVSLTSSGSYGLVVAVSWIWNQEGGSSSSSWSYEVAWSCYSGLINLNPPDVTDEDGNAIVPGPISYDLSGLSGISLRDSNGNILTGSLYNSVNNTIYNPVTGSSDTVTNWSYTGNTYTFETSNGPITYNYGPNYVIYTAPGSDGSDDSGRYDYVGDSQTVNQYEEEQKEEESGGFLDIGGAIASLIKGIFGGIAAILSGIVEGLTSLLSSVTSILGAFTEIPSSVLGFLSGLLDIFPEEVSSLFVSAFGLFVLVAFISFLRG